MFMTLMYAGTTWQHHRL